MRWFPNAGLRRRLPSALLGAVVRLSVWLNSPRLLAAVFAFIAKERVRSGGVRATGSDRRAVMLAISAEQFRGDPDCIAAEGTYRLFELSSDVLRKLVYRFYPSSAGWHHIVSPALGGHLSAQRQRYRRFLRAFLPHLYRRLGIQCVIGPHVHYGTDVDWGAVSQELGIPYVVLHRENLYASEEFAAFVRDRFDVLGARFEGEHIAVHNPVVRDVFVASNFVPPERISALGCARMDDYIRRIRTDSGRRLERRVTFFPLSLGPLHREASRLMLPFFNRLHVAMVRFAADHPDVEVVVKPKQKWAESWRGDVDRALAPTGLRAADLPNLVIRSDLNAQDLILSSAAVVGINSTTVIEAGIAGRYVVVPDFAELHDPAVERMVLFRDSFRALLLAKDEAELELHLLAGLSGRPIDPAVRRAYEQVFERYVSSLAGGAVQRHIALFKAVQSSLGARRRVA